jgi:hypothetical protein
MAPAENSNEIKKLLIFSKLRKVGDVLRVWRVAANIISRGQPKRGGSPASVLGVRLRIPHCKKELVRKYHKKSRAWTDSLDKRSKQKKMDMRFGWDGMGWYGLDRSDSGEGAVEGHVVMVINLWVPQNAGKFLSSCTIGGFSRRAQLHERGRIEN